MVKYEPERTVKRLRGLEGAGQRAGGRETQYPLVAPLSRDDR